MWKTALLLLLMSLNVHSQMRVAVIDTGLDLNDPRFKKVLCKTGHKDFTNTDIKDVIGHGTSVAGLIKEYAKNSNYCLLIYKFHSSRVSGQTNLLREIAAIKEAVDNNATIINLSEGGEGFSDAEYAIIRNNPWITFVVAAGNEGKDLSSGEYHYYPASYRLENVIAVGSLENNRGKPASSSNYGKFLVWEIGNMVKCLTPKSNTAYCSGTSFAAPIRTGKLLLSRAKHSRIKK